MWKYQKYHRVNWELVHFGEAKVHSFGELLANGRILCRIPCGTKINIHQHPPKPKALPAAVDILILCQENAYDIYRMYRYIFSPYIEEGLEQLSWSIIEHLKEWDMALRQRQERNESILWKKFVDPVPLSMYCCNLLYDLCIFPKNISFLFASLGEVSLWSDKIGVQPWDLRILSRKIEDEDPDEQVIEVDFLPC